MLNQHSAQKNRRSFGRSHLPEPMESRLLYSTVVQSAVKPVTEKLSPTFELIAHGKKLAQGTLSPSAASSTASGITPALMRSAYGLSNSTLANLTGAGQTIAIVDAYNDPNIKADLASFDSYFGLPTASLTVEGETGSTTSLPANSGTSGWSVEESLDVEWAHTIAPGANLLLVEASSTSDSDLFAAVKKAAAGANVSVVSMSFGGSEFSGETSDDTDFTTPAGHQGVTFLASTGDSASDIEYPSESPNVVAVGGTSLYTANAAYSSESAWSSGGGGPSAYETKPAYQSYVTTGSTKRTTPDVSMDADPNTGVPVFDTYDLGTGTPWEQVGGTSLASPMYAALVAVANQGRASIGLGTLTGAQTLTRLYQMSSTHFHDITSGSNGHSAVTGYDQATGIGSPIANMLIPDLAGVGTVSGQVFVDNNSDNTFNNADAAITGKTVYYDTNNDGIYDHNEPTMNVSSSGTFSFSDVPGGGIVRLTSAAVAGDIATSTASTLGFSASQQVNFTYFPTTITLGTASATDTLQTDTSNTNEQVLINGTLTYSVSKSLIASTGLRLNVTGNNETVAVNGTHGSPALTGALTITATGTGTTLAVTGTAVGNDTFIAGNGSFLFNGNPIYDTNVATVTLNPGSGTDSLSVNSGSVLITPQVPGDGILTRNFSSLSVASGAKAIFSTAPLHADRMLVEVAALSVAGLLDLGGNDMIIHNGNLAAISTLLASGFNNGLWNGTGIDSSAAANDPQYLTALGVIQNNLYGSSNPFDGASPVASDVLIKYTYYGDSNLDGVVNSSDYTAVENAMGTSATGWASGDFNYDQSVDGTDFTLLDNTYNTQGSAM